MNTENPPVYDLTLKHDKGGWGSNNPIKSQEEGQRLLDSGYHSYEVSKPRDIPAGILKQMLSDGKIS